MIIILDITPIDGSFTIINAYQLTSTDKSVLVNKYGLDSSYFPLIYEKEQIPRFKVGNGKYSLFLFDIPYHHKAGTTAIPIAINDSTDIIVFTNKETKYVIPEMIKLVSEKMSVNRKYQVPCLTVDTVKYLSDKYLDKIRDLDHQRIKDKGLLYDKSKHANQTYIADLSELRIQASGYVDSVASDLQLLKSISKVFSRTLTSEVMQILKEDIVLYNQVLIECTYCFRRIRAVERSYSLQISMNTNHKMNLITYFSFLAFPLSVIFSFYGANIGQAANGLPFASSWWSISIIAVIITAVFDLISLFLLKHDKR